MRCHTIRHHPNIGRVNNVELCPSVKTGDSKCQFTLSYTTTHQDPSAFLCKRSLEEKCNPGPKFWDIKFEKFDPYPSEVLLNGIPKKWIHDSSVFINSFINSSISPKGSKRNKWVSLKKKTSPGLKPQFFPTKKSCPSTGGESRIFRAELINLLVISCYIIYHIH